MNLRFVDKLSSTVFHNTASLPRNREWFQHWLTNKLLGAYCDRETDFEHGKDCPHPKATMGTLHIAVQAHAVTGDSTYNLVSREFDWWITEESIDSYGYVVFEDLPRQIINGVLYNSGTHTDPSWGSHT
jgi:hypothetical protein